MLLYLSTWDTCRYQALRCFFPFIGKTSNTIIITRVEMEDYGEYSCIVSNNIYGKHFYTEVTVELFPQSESLFSCNFCYSFAPLAVCILFYNRTLYNSVTVSNRSQRRRANCYDESHFRQCNILFHFLSYFYYVFALIRVSCMYLLLTFSVVNLVCIA